VQRTSIGDDGGCMADDDDDDDVRKTQFEASSSTA
jgi:hypothetical protein